MEKTFFNVGVASNNSAPGSGGGTSKHDFNPRSKSGPGLVVILISLFIFTCFVIFDPWKIVAPNILAPSTPEAEPVPPRPELSLITIKGRLRPIHHAVLKEIRKDGLIFLADEGLVKAAYKDLAPEFSTYYLYIGSMQRKRLKKAPTLLTDDSAPLNGPVRPASEASSPTAVPRS